MHSAGQWRCKREKAVRSAIASCESLGVRCLWAIFRARFLIKYNIVPRILLWGMDPTSRVNITRRQVTCASAAQYRISIYGSLPHWAWNYDHSPNFTISTKDPCELLSKCVGQGIQRNLSYVPCRKRLVWANTYIAHRTKREQTSNCTLNTTPKHYTIRSTKSWRDTPFSGYAVNGPRQVHLRTYQKVEARIHRT